MRFLTADDVESRFYRIGRIVYVETEIDAFFYSDKCAYRLFWRFFWLQDRPRIGL